MLEADRRGSRQAWAELMALLSYERYGAMGNDAGSMISLELASTEAGAGYRVRTDSGSSRQARGHPLNTVGSR